MKRAKNLANRTIQAAALLALALLMVVLFRAASGNGGLLAQSGPAQQLSTTLPSELPYPPPVTDWSPDSQYVAATGFVEGDGSCAEVNLTKIEQDACQFDQSRVIYIEDTKSGEVRQLISGYDPIWSPDGSKLAFISNRGGAQEIWLINFDGSGLIQLTSDGQPKGSLQVWLQEIEK